MEKSKNKVSECDTRFDDPYPLYKYNMSMDYHHIRNRDEDKANMKKK